MIILQVLFTKMADARTHICWGKAAHFLLSSLEAWLSGLVVFIYRELYINELLNHL